MVEENPVLKPLEHSINTLAVNTQIKPPLKIPLKDSCKLPVKRQVVKDIKHSLFLKCWLEQGIKDYEAYIKVYQFKGSKLQAQKNTSGLMKRIVMDLAKKKEENPLLFTPEALKLELHRQGLTLPRVAELLKSFIEGKTQKGINDWLRNEGADKLIRIFGAYAPTKQEIVHITPATSKDVAVELFRMFENSGYMRFIEQSVKIFKAGGRPEDVSIEAEYTVEDAK